MSAVVWSTVAADEATNQQGARRRALDVAAPVAHTITADAERATEGKGPFIFTVTRTGNIGQPSTVAWSLSGTVDAADFGGGLPGGIVRFGPDEFSKAIVITPTDDLLVEPDETMTVTLGAVTGTGAVLGNVTSASMVLVDNEIRPTVSVLPAQAFEGNTGSTSVDFAITRTGNLSAPTELMWSFEPGTASADDFVGGSFPTGGTLKFAAGEAQIRLSIPIAGDTQVEADESFTVHIAITSLGEPGVNRNIGTIRADDFNSWIAISSQQTSISEGDNGATPVEFVFSRAGATDRDASVSWRRGGAADSRDLAFYSQDEQGTVTFAPGEARKVVRIRVADDSTVELDETLSLWIVGVDGFGATANNSSATTLILDDEAREPVTIRASRSSVPEGAAGTVVEHTFTAERGGDLNRPANVAWSLEQSAGISFDDFVAGQASTGMLHFDAGQSRATIVVKTVGDSLYEPDEAFSVRIGPGDFIAGAAPDDQATVTLLNDDDRDEFRITLPKPALLEGSAEGGTTSFRFEVVRTGNVADPATVYYTIAGTGSNPATTSDFASSTVFSGSMNWPAGDRQKSLFVSVLQDTTIEADETFEVMLTWATGASVSPSQGSAQATILSDELAPSLSIRPQVQEIAEGNSGSTPVAFELRRSGDLSHGSTVNWSIGIVAHGRIGPDDLASAQDRGQLEFAPGQSALTLTLNVLGDQEIEVDEVLEVTLTSAAGAALVAGQSSASVRVTSEDTRPIVGTDRDNDKFTLVGLRRVPVVTYDPATKGVQLTTLEASVSVRDVEVLQLNGNVWRLAPDPAQQAIVQLERVLWAGFHGLDMSTYSTALSIARTQGIAAVGSAAAQAFYGGLDAGQMADRILSRLFIRPESLPGPDAAGTYQMAKDTLTAMFTGDSNMRGQALVTVLQTFSTMEDDPRFGKQAAFFNEKVGEVWIKYYADSPITLMGLPTELVEVPHP